VHIRKYTLHVIPPSAITSMPHHAHPCSRALVWLQLCVARVSSPAEAAALMADPSLPYGLTASVFSSSPSIARAVLEQLDVGTTYWNTAGEMPVTLPW
jgi:hypothetical protein